MTKFKMYEAFKEAVLGGVYQVSEDVAMPTCAFAGSAGFLCVAPTGHEGLHYSGQVQWTDDREDFLVGPYDKLTSNLCEDEAELGEGDHKTTYRCTRPKGHLGRHGNQHGFGNGDEDDIVWWGSELESPFTSDSIGVWGGATNQAAFEIVIDAGKVAVPKKVRLNGLEIPRLRSTTVRYEPKNVRTVILEIYATDIEEVSQ